MNDNLLSVKSPKQILWISLLAINKDLWCLKEVRFIKTSNIFSSITYDFWEARILQKKSNMRLSFCNISYRILEFWRYHLCILKCIHKICKCDRAGYSWIWRSYSPPLTIIQFLLFMILLFSSSMTFCLKIRDRTLSQQHSSPNKTKYYL